MTRSLTPLPASLGTHFSVATAVKRGVTHGRLRAVDLESPFYGVRMLVDDAVEEEPGPEELIRRQARAYSPRMRDVDFLSHSTAAALHRAPLPLKTDTQIHVSTFRPARAPRTRGVIGHSASTEVPVATVNGVRVSDPAETWAMLGLSLDVPWLVAVGDYFCRVWREGYGRPNAESVPLATPEKLARALNSCRRLGAAKLREALPFVRCDSWSPRESLTRFIMVTNGLPEPVLNSDFYDARGGHLACIDMAYPEYKVAVEYQGRVHGVQYSQDIERIERLRADGWIVVQVSSELFNEPDTLVRRVRSALRSRGWHG
ncbi:hypothetical protein [Paramicrobacterium agarici]|uniref:hypothetical protein n=1 Tax=Paramicrobacterium agarici TaxID=630514 RepID=UPI0011545954|nr:hypothetical protein [Microbacterium agarici]TQO23405.1 hypothetical protein FB385_2255 [Microbacterium agarici]